MLNALILAAVTNGSIIPWHRNWQPQNQRCANSQFITGDIVKTMHGNEMVVIIGKIVSRTGTTVGWTYETDHNRRYAQLSSNASRRDQDSLGIKLGPLDKVSGLIPLAEDPRNDLRLKACARNEMVSADKVPWKP